MTGPNQPLSIQQQAWNNDATLATLDTAVTAAITVHLLQQLTTLLGSVTRAWVTLFGRADVLPATRGQAVPIVELVHAVLDQIHDDVPERVLPALGDGIRAAYVLGLKQGGMPRRLPSELRAEHAPRLFVPYAAAPKPVVRQLAAAVHYDVPTADDLIRKRERDRVIESIRRQLAEAKKLITPSTVTEHGLTRVQTAIATARKLEQRVDMAVSWHLLYANQQAVSDAAKVRGLALIWVSERDSCVVCTALNGEVVDPGDTFDVSATFGTEAPVAVWPIENHLPHPPRHNHCRCRCEAHDRRDTGVVDALKREAKRSIVKGWSTDSESGQVRRRAAEALLARGAGLPRTVEDRARRAVKSKDVFGGPVPDGR